MIYALYTNDEDLGDQIMYFCSPVCRGHYRLDEGEALRPPDKATLVELPATLKSRICYACRQPLERIADLAKAKELLAKWDELQLSKVDQLMFGAAREIVETALGMAHLFGDLVTDLSRERIRAGHEDEGE